MDNITPDEVRQMEINELRTKLNKIKAEKSKSEFKDIHEINFTSRQVL